jgi:hypothetical protein
MARKLIKRYLPEMHTIRHHKHLRIFGSLLHDPNLWHLNRRSVAGAFAVGLFMAFMPVPLQMVPAAAAAIFFRVNLPISVALVWITNPLTMPPVYYLCYRIGAWLLGRPMLAFTADLSWTGVATELLHTWQPFLVGCLVIATGASALGYFGMQGLWRWHVVREWEKRKSNHSRRRRVAR